MANDANGFKHSHRPDAQDETDLGPLSDYVGFHLRTAQNASFRAFKRHTGDGDLRPGRFAVLSLIGSNGGITPMALARASGRDKSTITPVLRDLLDSNLVRRTTNPADRRSYGLHLTPAGEDKLAGLAVHAAAHDNELDALVGDQKTLLITLLRRIASHLD